MKDSEKLVRAEAWSAVVPQFLRAVGSTVFMFDGRGRTGLGLSGAARPAYRGRMDRFRDDPRSLFDGVHPDDAELLHTTLDQALASTRADQVARAQIRMVRPTGDFGLYQLQCQLVEAAPGESVLIGQLCALTAAAEVGHESRDAANIATADVVSKMSHELRTPLHAILGYAQLLEMGAGETGDYLKRLRRAGHHVVQLLDDLLDYSRLVANRLHFADEFVDVGAVLAEAIDLTAPAAGEHRVRVESKIADGLIVRGDHKRVCQVLVNLLANAIKYNRPDGEVVAVAHAHDGRVSVSITDTGPGLADEDIERVFAPFERLRADSSGVSGAGLGLPLSEGFARAMGGSITVSHPAAGGCTFTVELPAVDQELLDLTGEAPKPVRILCIEDDGEGRTILDAALSRLAHADVQIVSCANDGLDALRDERFTAVIVDRHLPDMDGDELLRHVLEIAHGTPVIAISSDNAIELPSFIRPPVVAALSKPLDLDRFIATVEEVTGAR